MCTGQTTPSLCGSGVGTHLVQVLRTSGIKLSCIQHISPAISSTGETSSEKPCVQGGRADPGRRPSDVPHRTDSAGGERRVNSELPSS